VQRSFSSGVKQWEQDDAERIVFRAVEAESGKKPTMALENHAVQTVY
jgi:hypothetical protein